MNELIEKLRDMAANPYWDSQVTEVCKEAADALEYMQAKLELKAALEVQHGPEN